MKLRKAHLRVQTIRPREAAGEHEVGATGAEFFGGEFQGIERRGTGGVEREGGAANAQGLGENGRGQARDVAIERVSLRSALFGGSAGDLLREKGSEDFFGEGRRMHPWEGRCCR